MANSRDVRLLMYHIQFIRDYYANHTVIYSIILTCHEVTNYVNNIFFNYVERTIIRIIFAYVLIKFVSINNLISSRRLFMKTCFSKTRRKHLILKVLLELIYFRNSI